MNCVNKLVLFFILAATGAVYAQDAVKQDLNRDMINSLNFRIDQVLKGYENDPYRESDKPSPVEQEWLNKGFIAYMRDWNRSVYPSSFPDPEERGRVVSIFAAPGGQEQFSFSIRSLDTPLDGVEFQVGDFVGLENEGTIPSGNFRLGVVEYFRIRWGENSSSKKWRWHPTRIWPLESYPGNRFCFPTYVGLGITPRTSQRFWARMQVPDDALPGNYVSEIRIICSTGFHVLPVYLTVLDCEPLAKPDLVFAVAVPGTQDIFCCNDLAAHGINSLLQWYDPRQIPLSMERGKLRYDFTLQDKFMQRLRRAGVDGLHVIVAGKRPIPAFERELTACTGLSPDSSGYLPIYAESILEMANHAASEGWNTFCWLIADRLEEDGKSRDWYAKRAGSIDRIASRAVRLVSPLGVEDGRTIEALAPTTDYWIVQESPAGMRKNAQTQANVLSLVSLTQRNDSGDGRLAVGFGTWARGYDGSVVWAYNWPGGGHPWNDFDSPTMDWMLAYRDIEDNMIPTQAWQGVSEGVADMRYVATLESLLARAPAEMEEASQARVALADIRRCLMGDIGIEEISMPENSPASSDISTAGRLKAIVAGHIVRLSKIVRLVESEFGSRGEDR